MPLVTKAIEIQLDRDTNSILDDAGVHIQYDEGCPHYVLPFLQWIENESEDGWIGQTEAIKWPASSAELSSLDLFGHLNYVV